MNEKIAFIGAGSMAEAIIAGVVRKGIFKGEEIFVTNRSNQKRLQELQEEYGVIGITDKAEVIKDAAAVIISPKPNDIESTLMEIKELLTPGQLLISVVAGVSAAQISTILGKEVAIIRSMPNTSATIGESATGISKGPYATEEQLEIAKAIFSAVGRVVVIEEQEMHTLTAISGSGPAYIYYLVEAMEEAAIAGGLEAELAKELIVQTIIGAGEMLKQSTDSADELRRKVTSPNGVTAAGIEALSNHGFQSAINACITAATSRSKELGEE